MNEYFHKLNNYPKSNLIKQMNEYAKAHSIPIINDEGLTFLLQVIRLKKPKRILEIGTAIGYSAIMMATVLSDVVVDTIERDEEMYQQAKNNIADSGLAKRINIYLADALELDISELDSSYDVIFIDAAKAQYQKFFTKYSALLPPFGIVISDNLLFHGFVEEENIAKSKNLRHLIEKIDRYNKWLSSLPNYRTSFLAIGDGMAVSEKLYD